MRVLTIFKTYTAALKRQAEIKKDYGYKPTIYCYWNPINFKYWAMIEPKGVRKLKRK